MLLGTHTYSHASRNINLHAHPHTHCHATLIREYEANKFRSHKETKCEFSKHSNNDDSTNPLLGGSCPWWYCSSFTGMRIVLQQICEQHCLNF